MLAFSSAKIVKIMRKDEWLSLLILFTLRSKRQSARGFSNLASQSLRMAQICLKMFCRQRRRSVRHVPALNFDSLSPSKFEVLFRFLPHDFDKLLSVLRLNDLDSNGILCSARNRLLLTLFRLSYPRRLTDVATIFGISKSKASIIFNSTLKEILSSWSHLLYTLNRASFSSERMDM